MALILGAARIGAVTVPFSTRLRAGEIAYLVDHSVARIMLVSPEGADLLAAAFPALTAQRGPAVRVPEAASGPRCRFSTSAGSTCCSPA